MKGGWIKQRAIIRVRFLHVGMFVIAEGKADAVLNVETKKHSNLSLPFSGTGG
jgi:hypothetical protein